MERDAAQQVAEIKKEVVNLVAQSMANLKNAVELLERCDSLHIHATHEQEIALLHEIVGDLPVG